VRESSMNKINAAWQHAESDNRV